MERSEWHVAHRPKLDDAGNSRVHAAVNDIDFIENSIPEKSGLKFGILIARGLASLMA